MIRIGIAGLGRLGEIHLQQISTVNEFEVCGLYDLDPARVQQASGRYGFQGFDSFEGMLEHCGAVLIATPTSSHFEYAEKAIRAGCHVFIEKPITAETEEAQKLTNLAEEAGVFIQVGHVERFNPAFMALRDRDVQPRFIESHRLAPFNKRGTDVSVVLDLMIHDIDIILYMVRSNVQKVNANGVAVLSDNIDIANARIEFDNGAVANLTASRISLKKMRKMRMFQPFEYISLDFLESKLDIVRMAEAGEKAGIPLDIQHPDKRIVVERPSVVQGNAIRQELLSFARSIRYGIEPEINGPQAAKALDLANQISYRINKDNLH